MTVRPRLVALTLIAVTLVVTVGSASVLYLYRTGLSQEGAVLLAMAESQSTLLQAAFEAELGMHAGDTSVALDATLQQLRASQSRFRGFGGSVEFSVAQRDGDEIRFLAAMWSDSARVPRPISLPSQLGIPIQRALAGDSDVVVAPDHRGVQVLAGFTPVRGTPWGLVAKKDLWEVRRPFVRATMLAGAVGLLLIVTALGVAWVVGRPLLEEVEELERAHRTFLDNFPGVAFKAVRDPRGEWRFDRVEGAVEELTGFPAEHLVREGDPMALVVEEDRSALRLRLSSADPGAAPPSESEYRIRKKDGSVARVGTKFRLVPEDRNEAAALYGVAHDVTALREGEEQLKRREAELVALVRNLPGGAVHELDRDFRYMFSAGEALERMGLSHEALKGKRIHEVFPSDRAEKVIARYRRVLKGDTVRFEGSFGGRDLLVTAAPLWDEDDEVERILVLWVDVTEQRAQARALADSEERFREALDHLPDLVAIYGPDLRIRYVNEAARAMTGLPPEHFVGKRNDEIWPPEVYRSYVPVLEEAAATGQMRSVEAEVDLPDHPRWIHVVCVPLRDGSALREIVLIVHDLTERRMAEEEIRSLADGLEVKVQERTHELQSTNDELESFAYSVSHDLRAPLRAIDGYSAILADTWGGTLDEDGRHLLGEVRDNAQRMGRLISDLLAFSRVGRVSLAQEVVDLGPVVSDLVDRYGELERGRSIDVSVQALPHVRGDPALLRQALDNVLGNAVKFTRRREVARIEVAGAREGENVRIEVRDNGVGFDPTHGHKVFGVFERLHDEVDFEGTGVGLAIVKRIVERHGGRVWADSEVGEGTVIGMELPAPWGGGAAA